MNFFYLNVPDYHLTAHKWLTEYSFNILFCIIITKNVMKYFHGIIAHPYFLPFQLTYKCRSTTVHSLFVASMPGRFTRSRISFLQPKCSELVLNATLASPLGHLRRHWVESPLGRPGGQVVLLCEWNQPRSAFTHTPPLPPPNQSAHCSSDKTPTAAAGCDNSVQGEAELATVNFPSSEATARKKKKRDE